MKLRSIAASEFNTFDVTHQALLKRFGTVAVSDKLLPIWETDYKIGLWYGGRGGGKSEGQCDKLLDECLTQEYFKCYYGRKVFDTVRRSCFEMLVNCIKKNNLKYLFHFSEANTSSMVITCLLNGNKFVPFGSDEPDKLKSLENPTHIWCEEFDQFTFDDFRVLLPTLRTPKGANRFIGTFNTHEVVPSHWLLKLFFPEIYEGIDKDDAINADIVSGILVKKVFINFTDNYFINQEEYRKTLWLASAGNTTIFEGMANGAWGIMPNSNPWLFAWNSEKHMAKTELFANPLHILYLSWDFNRNPMACSAMQDYDETLFIIDVIKKSNIGTEGVCDIILARYPRNKYVYVVTGDYAGNTASSLYQEQVTNYTVIKSKLGLSDAQIKIEPNPRLEKNRTLVNAVFFSYKIQVCPVKARHFKFDAENVRQSPEGKIEKDNRKDPAQQADVLDTVRYYINKFMSWFIKLPTK